MGAEVYICRRIAERTDGTYGVALGADHLNELLLAHVTPPVLLATESTKAPMCSLVKMGFPAQVRAASLPRVTVAHGQIYVTAIYVTTTCHGRTRSYIRHGVHTSRRAHVTATRHGHTRHYR